jgi:hypothetical protein
VELGNGFAAGRLCSLMGVQLNGCTAFLDVQPCLERIPRCLSDGTDLLALDLTSTKNRCVHECGRGVSSVLLSRIFFFRSKAVLTADSSLCSLLSIRCNAILLNAMHIGDCYRTFPYALRAVAIPWSLDQDRTCPRGAKKS